MFNNKELRWRLYTTAKVLVSTREVELVEKKEFVIVAFDLENEIFISHVASLAIFDEIHYSRKA